MAHNGLQEDRANRESRMQMATPIYSLQRDTPAFPTGTDSIFVRATLAPASGNQPLQVLRKGAIQAFVKTCERWKLATKDQIVLLGYGTNHTTGANILNGRVLSPSQDVRDRTGYVLGISLGLGAVFDESAEVELAWLRKPHPKLGKVAPLTYMLEGRMANLIAVADLVAEERALR
jgi:hypothetical protein